VEILSDADQLFDVVYRRALMFIRKCLSSSITAALRGVCGGSTSSITAVWRLSWQRQQQQHHGCVAYVMAAAAASWLCGVCDGSISSSSITAVWRL